MSVSKMKLSSSKFEIFYPIEKLASGSHYKERGSFGPAPSNSFNNSLQFQVKNKANVQAIACGFGKIRVFSDNGDTCSLLLICDLSRSPTLEGAESIQGNRVLFLYEHLLSQSVRDSFEPRIKTQRSIRANNTTSLTDDLTAFMSGKMTFHLRNNTVNDKNHPNKIGQPKGVDFSNASNHDPFLVFSIILINSDATEDSWWLDLYTRSTDPTDVSFRRFDPPSFFKLAESLNVISSIHSSHPLFKTFTNRRLIEFRNEYDLPSAISPKINGVKTTNLNRGYFVVPGSESKSSFVITLDNFKWVKLPSSKNDNKELTLSLKKDDPVHLAVQHIYMADKNSSDNWFVKSQNTDLPRFTEKNKITPLIDGIETYDTMLKEIDLVKNKNDFFRINGWSMDIKFPMQPSGTGKNLKHYIDKIANSKASVQVFLWQTSVRGYLYPTRFSYYYIDRILKKKLGKNAAAALEHYFVVGSHHQKISIIQNKNHAVAFCGGVDVWGDRMDNSEHTFGTPLYHDVHAKIEGPAVKDINTTFLQRWNVHPGVIRRNDKIPAGQTLSFKAEAGSDYVQISRTYKKKKLPHQQKKERGILKAILQSINKAQKYIYIEDQYFTPYAGKTTHRQAQDTLGFVNALIDALNRIDYLIIVIPNHISVPTYDARRKLVFDALFKKAKEQGAGDVFVFYLNSNRVSTNSKLAAMTKAGNITTKSVHSDDNLNETKIKKIDLDIESDIGKINGSNLTEEDIKTALNKNIDFVSVAAKESGSDKYPNEIYVHTKAIIVDDVIAKIGSANCNRRSYTHDGEADMFFIDGAVDKGSRKSVKQFRKRLWSEHLDVPEHSLDDYKHALYYWKNLNKSAHARDYDTNRGEGDKLTDRDQLRWNNLYDPEG